MTSNNVIEEGFDIDKNTTIKRLCDQWTSFEEGFAEIIKNSNDQYERLDSKKSITQKDREIILFFRDKTKDLKAAIGVLDFGGMSLNDINERLLKWNSPKEKLGTMDLAAFGNGGKIFALKYFDQSFWHTFYDKNSNRIGYGKSSRTRDNGLPYGRATMREVKNENNSSAEKDLNNILKNYFDLSFNNLPDNVKIIINIRKSFTFFVGLNPDGIDRKIKVSPILDIITNHHQCIPALERSNVTYFRNKQYENHSLYLAKITPKKGYEKQRKYLIPDTLIDPTTNQEIKTGSNEKSVLTLNVAEKNLSRTKFKSRWRIFGKTTDLRPTGYFNMQSLNHTIYSNYIYGEILLDYLNDPQVMTNNRSIYFRTPLIEALEAFISEKISEIAEEMEGKDKQKYDKSNMKDVAQFVEKITNFVSESMDSIGAGIGKGGKGGSGIEKKKKIRNKAAQIEMSFTHNFCGKGVYFEPVVKFFDSENKEAEPEELDWHFSDQNIVDEYLVTNMIIGKTPGSCKVKVSSKNGLTSNTVEIEVVDVVDLNFSNNLVQVKERSKHKVDFEVTTSKGDKIKDIYLNWVSNDEDVTSVSSSGIVFGRSIGKTQITASDDDTTSSPLDVIVVENENKNKDKGNSSGGIDIRITNYHKRPDDDDVYRPKAASGLPPVFADTLYLEQGIWWINTDSPLATILIKKGSDKIIRDTGMKTKEAKLYYIERVGDIYSRADVRKRILDMNLDKITSDDYERYKDTFITHYMKLISADLENFIK